MTSPTDESKLSGSLDSLCDIVTQTIKEISASRQPISPTVIRQALSQKQEIVSLLSPSSQPPRFATETAAETDDSTKELKNRLQTMDAQRRRLTAQVEGLEEQNAKIREFNKRSLTSFIALLRIHDNKTLAKSLNQFKKMLLDGAEIETLEKSFHEIKNIVLKEQGEAAPKAGRSEPGIWGRLTRRKGPDEIAALPSDPNFEKLKEAYLEIFGQFHSDLGKEYLDTFTRTQQSIRASQDIDQLLSRTSEIIHLIQAYTRLINEERTRVISLFTEIGSNLAEMETHFMASVDHSSKAQQADIHFNETLEGQLQDINDSAQFTKSLEEFKGLVFNKLTTIKSAIERKREADELRQIEIAREVEGLQKSLKTLKNEVAQAEEKAKVLEWETLIDPLTGIHNRRAYERRMGSELQRFQRYEQIFSVILFDLDHFKNVNDQYGHHAGDRCLKEIIKRIQPALREPDFLARYGGEEFILILPGTGREAAYNVAERLRNLIEKTRFLYQGETIPLTISLGVTEAGPGDQNVETLFTRVDSAVYEAKRTGRNRVVSI